MGKFHTPLKVEEISSGGLFERGKYRLLAPLVYWSDSIQDYIIVNERDVTDFDSTPRFIPFLYALLGNRSKPAMVLHDHGYDGKHETITGHGIVLSRAEWDKVLRGANYECLRIDNPETISDSLINLACLGIAWAIWAGVRLGGWSHWK